MDSLVVVVVDDNADDRRLVRREIEAAFPRCTVIEAADPGVFRAVLGRPVIDAVITDYELRWSDGLAVLRQVRAQAPEAVVIMYTGSGSQELAVQAMKEGLDDYVTKGQRNLARLPIALRMALERRALRRRAEELETRHRVLFNRLNVGIFRADLFGQLIEANEAMLRLLGAPTLQQARSSPMLRVLLWDGGIPAATDFLRDRGDRRDRVLELPTPDGAIRRFLVRDLVTRHGDEAFVDGVVEAIPDDRSA